MVVTGDEQTAAAVRMLRDHGAEISDHARHESGLGELPEFNRPGFNYRMTDLQGALGTTQMLKLPGILRERARRAVEYDRLLGDVSWFRTPFCPEGFTHTYQSYVCRIEIPDRTPEQLGKVRGRLMKHLDAAGIAARPGTHAVHLLGYYKKKYGLRPEHCPNAMKAHFNTITFPLYPEMTEEEQTHVVKSISTFNP